MEPLGRLDSNQDYQNQNLVRCQVTPRPKSSQDMLLAAPRASNELATEDGQAWSVQGHHQADLRQGKHPHQPRQDRNSNHPSHAQPPSGYRSTSKRTHRAHRATPSAT